jgi:hypothetical protein
VTLTLTPTTRSAGVWTVADVGAPRLTWSTTNVASVIVTGPGGLSSVAPSGAEFLCPTPPSGPGPHSTCNGLAGAYAYTLTARDAGGAVVATRTVVLTLT